LNAVKNRIATGLSTAPIGLELHIDVQRSAIGGLSLYSVITLVPLLWIGLTINPEPARLDTLSAEVLFEP